MYGYNSYKTNDIETASQLKLIVMMYGGAIKFTTLAIKNIADEDFAEANTNVIKAQNIVSELLASLDFSAGNIAEELSGLYIYIHRLLVEANIQKTTPPLQEALDLLTNLKEGWDDLLLNEDKNKNNNKQDNINITS